MILGACGGGSSSSSASIDSAPAEEGETGTYNAASETQDNSYSETEVYEVEDIVAEFEAEKARNASGIVVAKMVVGQLRTWDSTGTFHSIPFTLYCC